MLPCDGPIFLFSPYHLFVALRKAEDNGTEQLCGVVWSGTVVPVL